MSDQSGRSVIVASSKMSQAGQNNDSLGAILIDSCLSLAKSRQVNEPLPVAYRLCTIQLNLMAPNVIEHKPVDSSSYVQSSQFLSITSTFKGQFAYKDNLRHDVDLKISQFNMDCNVLW